MRIRHFYWGVNLTVWILLYGKSHGTSTIVIIGQEIELSRFEED